MKYIIGIDIGTTNIKGSLYSSSGDFIARSSTAYESYSPKENYHEQNPFDWVNGIIDILKKITSTTVVMDKIEAMSISTQGGTIVPVDENFNPLINAITWLDRRAVEELKKSRELLRKNIKFYNKTGWRLDTNISFMPVYWLKKYKKDIFNKIHKVLFVNDFVLKKITDINYQDPSNASISLFYNIRSGNWDKEILSLLDFDETKFSPVKDSGEIVGYLKKDICKKIGVRKKIKVVNGGHDQYCAAIGAGILSEKEVLLTTGTAWVVFKMLDNPLLDSKRFFAIGRNIIKNKYGLIYSIPAAGASLKWFANSLMNLEDENELFRRIEDSEAELMNIKNNLLFYPYLTGAFGPDFNIDKKASFLNIEIGHTYLDFVKAIMEGAGFQLKKIFMVFKEKGIEIENIKMVGGGVKGKIWPQVIADITGVDILVPEDEKEDFAVKGAAILAGYGAGIFSSIKEGYNRLKSEFEIIKPNLKNIDFYENKFKIFKI